MHHMLVETAAACFGCVGTHREIISVNMLQALITFMRSVS